MQETPAIEVTTLTAADVAEAARVEADEGATEARLKEELARPWSRVWILRVAPRGILALLVSWHVADELHILNVATSAANRRRGYARRLMDTAVHYAKEKRLRHVLLEVRRSNAAAIALYRGVGFFAMGVRARYYPDDEDAVEMVLLLDPLTGETVAHEDEVRLEERA